MLRLVLLVSSAVLLTATNSNVTMSTTTSTTIGVGFGTAGLGAACYDVTLLALETGFRKFDTAEADWWYDQKAVGRALQDFVLSAAATTCQTHDLRISTKIPPWSLTSFDDIRSHAAASRAELVGFCDGLVETTTTDSAGETSNNKFPLDVYYIHAPRCWKGWHGRCEDAPPTLDLRSAWLAMEAVVGWDHSAQRIGLSNVRPDELLDILQFVKEREKQYQNDGSAPPPRKPDVLQAYADPIQPAEELRRICHENGIEFVSYSTLGTQHRSTKNGNPVLGSPIVSRIAQKHDRSTAEVVLSWALQKGMSIIPRSSKRPHIQELARLLGENPGFLDADDLAHIDAMKNTV